MKETKVSPYLKNLQQNALFYLQMAALLLLLFILMDPFIPKEQGDDEHTIFIVDTSATMTAVEDDLSLFEANRAVMKEIAEERAGESFSLITTGKEPSIILREERDARKVLEAIEHLDVEYENEKIDRSIDIARSIIAGSSADIHIFTDQMDRSAFVDTEEGIHWTVHVNEAEIANISIEKFGAILSDDGVEAILKVNNQTEQDITGTAIIWDELSGKKLLEKPFEIEKKDTTLVSFQQLPETIALRAEIDVNDDYSADNSAFVLIGNDASEAIVDSNLHELIKKAFDAIGLAVTTGSAAEMKAAVDQAIIVTNDVSFLQEGVRPILLIGRNDERAEEISGQIKTEADPLFSLGSIDDVYVQSIYPSFEEYETIAYIGEQPFIQRSKRGDIIILTDIGSTDWPLHPSFPLFFWSAVESLRSGTDIAGLFHPNERKAILSSGMSDDMEVFTVKDEYVESFANGNHFIAPMKPGIYKLIDGGKEKYIAVQLESTEKSIGSGSSFKFGSDHADGVKEEGKNKFGWLFVLPVLLLLLIEWEVQRRRGYPN